ncbi:MAG TPA: amidohydrolase family protein [Planctomycetia bacterium]|nr:amidohydrolase family protein [Planctomycetia bacterium]
MSACCLILSATIFAASPAQAPAPAKAFVGAQIHAANGQVYSPGVLVIQDGKIVAVGPQATTPIPGGAQFVSVERLTIIPGLVDTHSHLGLFGRGGGGGDGNEMSGPVQTSGRAADAINPMEAGIRMATAGGVTTANIMPGSGNVIGGQTLYVKLRGRTIDEMRVEAQGVLGGIKMANGENPKRAYGGKSAAPVTRMKTAALQRGEFIKARDYLAKKERFAEKQKAGKAGDAQPPELNPDLEPLVEVLQRKRTVHFHTHRADDIMTAVRLRDEFGFELVIQHGTESFKVAEELAKRKIPVSMTVVDSPGGKPEVAELTERCGAELIKKGVKVIINTDDPVTDSRFLMRTAATALRGGLTHEQALEAITKNAAEALHLGHRLGTLDVGKDADFVILSGDPFSVYSRVRETWIDGKPVFVAERDGAYQYGGFQLPAEMKPPAPPLAVAANVPAAARDLAARRPDTASGIVAVLADVVHPVSGAPILDGGVLVQNGKIAYVGPRAGMAIPAGAAILQARHVTPGLIDPLSQVPLSGMMNLPADQDQDEKSGPVQADLRVLDAFNSREPHLRFLLETGVTVIHSCPGRINVIAGQTGIFRTYGRTAEGMTVRFPHGLLINLGNPVKTAYPNQKPGTRMGVAGLVRTAFTGAQTYQKKQKSPKEEARPDANPANDALALALDKKIDVVFAAQRADDLVTGLRLAKEFNLRPTLALGAEAYLVADDLVKSKTPIFLHPTMQGTGDSDSINTYLGSAAALVQRGVSVSIASGMESYVPKTRVVRYEAGVAANFGLGADAALRAITLEPARQLRIADRFGSLEVGKVGDLVLYDGDPFEYRTHVLHVVVGGEVAYSRAEREGVPFARRLEAAGPLENPCCLTW